jgi:oxygen-independent coproporphyrinogen-3 oxidase
MMLPDDADGGSMAPIAQLTSISGGDQAQIRPRTAADLPIFATEDALTGIYVHVPFCRHKCHYCDFYSLVDAQDRQPAFAARLIDEIASAASRLPRAIETLFVGGGTPTLLAPDLWSEVLEALNRHVLETGPGREFTVEANPESVTEPLVTVLAAGGVNRLSIGVQSFQPRHLETLERHHDPAAATRSLALARAAGIDNISLDLIFGVPGQRLDDWLGDLDAAVALEPDHLSCYGLTYEPNTPLTARLRAGGIKRVDQDVEAAMYEAAIDRLGQAGFEHYEISNWARSGRRCRHNVLYWNNEQWWPLGPGAAGHIGGWRWTNAPRLGDYLAGRGLPSITGAERLDDDGRVGEVLMLGLRLVEGIALDCVEGLLALGVRGPQRAESIDRHVGAGLLARSDGRLHLTRAGLLLADRVLADLI